MRESVLKLNTIKNKNWTREQILIALNLYFQLPFGKLHKGNPLIINTAKLIERTPDSLAMKLCNLASLDPSIINSGRKGLTSASKLDKEIWAEFQHNSEEVGYESQVLIDIIADKSKEIEDLSSNIIPDSLLPSYFAENVTTQTQVRLKQSFFRKAVLNSYDNRCCMTGISDSRLLIASHIVPWSQDKNNRLNPSNGLCLSALHDKAYDGGLMTVTADFIIKISPQLQYGDQEHFTKSYLLKLDGQKINLPNKFVPTCEFLDYHYSNIFLR
jgi:predicted restriction endonuclease